MKTKKTKIPVWVVMQNDVPMDVCIRNEDIGRERAIVVMHEMYCLANAKIKRMILIEEK